MNTIKSIEEKIKLINKINEEKYQKNLQKLKKLVQPQESEY